MFNSRLNKIILLIITVGITVSGIYFDSVNLFTLLAYLASVLVCFFIIKDDILIGTFKKPKQSAPNGRKDLLIIFLLIILQVIFLQYFSHFPNHSHWDEYITAKISYTLPSIKEINWFAGLPRDKGQWVSQFPIVFFILQKPFFTTLGPSVEAVRISTLPYSALIIAYLYFLAKELSNRRTFAFISAAAFTVLAPNLYLSSLGLHFISSNFFYLASFYYFVRLYKTEEKKYSILCGLFAALAYLTYASSYITLPLLSLFVIIESVTKRSTRQIKLIIPALIIFLVIMLPFALFAFTKENFFMQRIDQVNFVSGELSHTKDKIKAGERIQSLLKNQFATSVKSLYTKDIGGAGGYDFGHKALFNPLTFDLIILGFILCIYQGIFLKRRTMIYVILTVLASFILGMVLTVPLGGFHRFSIAFPFFAIIVALSIDSIAQLVARTLSWKWTLPAISIAILVLFAYTNFASALEMVKEDRMPDAVPIAAFIQKNFASGSKFEIAAFGTYALERELLFRTHDKYKFFTDSHTNLFPHVNETPVIILLNAMPLIESLWPQLPNGTTIDSVDNVKLKDHVIFFPGSSYEKLSDKNVHVVVLFNSSKDGPGTQPS